MCLVYCICYLLHVTSHSSRYSTILRLMCNNNTQNSHLAKICYLSGSITNISSGDTGLSRNAAVLTRLLIVYSASHNTIYSQWCTQSNGMGYEYRRYGARRGRGKHSTSFIQWSLSIVSFVIDGRLIAILACMCVCL